MPASRPAYSRALLRSLALPLLASAGEAGAQGAIECRELTTAPVYQFHKVLDFAEADLGEIEVNDRGHALMTVAPAGASSPNQRCLLRNRGGETETLVCTRALDAASLLVRIEQIDWNQRGTIVLAGQLFGSTSEIQVIETSGAIVGLPTHDPGVFLPPKCCPAVNGFGDVVYLGPDGDLLRFDATLPGPDKSALIVSAATASIAALEPSGASELYYQGTGQEVGRVLDAFGPAPQVQKVPLAGIPALPNRFGAFVYLGDDTVPSEFRRRLGLTALDTVVLERDVPEAPIVSGNAALAGACKVAFPGIARGLCVQGPRDRFACDPTAPMNECSDGSGGPLDGYCQPSVDGVFVWQSGEFAAVARPGDAMLGSEVQDFFTGAGPQAFQGSNGGQIFFPVRLADGRQVLVRAEPVGGSSSPALPDACAGPSCRFGLQPDGWIGVGASGVPLYFDPDVAVGYDYAVDAGDPNFASVVVPDPLPNGDAHFTLVVGAQSFPLAAGEPFDLTALDAAGVAAFSIRGISPGEALDPEDPMAFVTGATFMEARAVTVTMTAVVPEPGAAAGGAAIAALAALARRRAALP